MEIQTNKNQKKINKVKKEQETAFEKFVNFKQAFSEVNNVLKDRLGDVLKKRRTVRRKNFAAEKERKKQSDFAHCGIILFLKFKIILS